MPSPEHYVLEDEPKPPIQLAKLVVPPSWPLLASMILSWSVGLVWLLTNSLAMGSATRRGDLLLGLLAPVVALICTGGLVLGVETETFSRGLVPYLFILITGAKLTVSYVLFLRQNPSYALFQELSEVGGSPGALALVFFLLNRALKELLDGFPLLGLVFL